MHGWTVRVALPVGSAPSIGDAVSGVLWSWDPWGIEELEGAAVLAGGFARAGDAHAAADAVTALLADLGAGGVVEVVAVRGDDYLDAWMAHAVPVAVPPFVLVPSWTDAEVAPSRDGSEVLVLDAGRTFGIGGHATTRLALAALVALDLRGRSVLDVGCGSGVLAIAAARLGAASVVALDVDPEAVWVTIDNARRNDVDHVVTASVGSADAVRDRFDVVVANVELSTHRAIAASVSQRVADGGRLVVSGALADRRDALAALYTGTVVDEREADGWVALTMVAAARGG